MEATQHIEVSSEELSLIAQGIDHYRNAAEGHRNKPLVEELLVLRRRITHDRGVAARRHLEARVHGTPNGRDGHPKWAMDRVEQGLGN